MAKYRNIGVGYGTTREERFYAECVLAGIEDFTIQKNIEKAKLFATKYGFKLDKTTIEQLFEESKEAYEGSVGRIRQLKENADKAKEQKEYKELYEKLNAFSNLVGREKRTAMLESEISRLEKEKKAADSYKDMLARAGQQKERAWGWYGGIADGIAGPGAGIMAALQVEANNAEIRESNRMNMMAKMPMMMSISDQIAGKTNNIEALREKINETQEKLIGEEASLEIYKKLKISPGIVSVMNDGAHMVTTEIELPEDMHIYGDVAAVVDGTLKAHVYCGDEEISVINLVLPADGVQKNAVLQGMSLTGARKGEEYYVRYSEGNIFLIEKYSAFGASKQEKVLQADFKKAVDLMADELPEI